MSIYNWILKQGSRIGIRRESSHLEHPKPPSPREASEKWTSLKLAIHHNAPSEHTNDAVLNQRPDLPHGLTLRRGSDVGTRCVQSLGVRRIASPKLDRVLGTLGMPKRPQRDPRGDLQTP